MKPISRLSRVMKAVQELGFQSVWLNGVYRLGLWSGYWKLRTPLKPARSIPQAAAIEFNSTLPNPDEFRPVYRAFMQQYPQAVNELLTEAEEIRNGKIRLFGGPPVPIQLEPPGPLPHWSDIESGRMSLGKDTDLKFIWEPARFGLAFPLARAYMLSGDEDYAQSFWQNMHKFLRANPVNAGPNWISAQEVALRLIALTFAAQMIPPPDDAARQNLMNALADHARRIPPTLIYARSQRNNHLITEALGLYTAGLALSGSPQAESWRTLGWKWLEFALLDQIEPDGIYTQHSSNYHRLMLQAALWGWALARLEGRSYSEPVRQRLASAATWLADQTDTISGTAWNLGANDGARILPLDSCGFADFRPTVQAAGVIFAGKTPFPPGPWDELHLWLAWLSGKHAPETPPAGSPAVSSPTRLWAGAASASLRAASFKGRPSHADQLHVDLWHMGENITLDAGTYRYTAAAPWDNALAVTAVHNTITLDGQDQMLRAGRFLWLNWAQAYPLSQTPASIEAIHEGYLPLGAAHRRRLDLPDGDHCLVTDIISPAGKINPRQYTICLHWLLPDWPWRFESQHLLLEAPFGQVRIWVDTGGAFPLSTPPHIRLIRAGKLLTGEGQVSPILGWYAPTYSIKLPALSLQVIIRSHLPVWLKTNFEFQSRSGKNDSLR